MNRTTLPVVLFLLTCGGVLRADELPWQSDYAGYERALEEAKAQKKPVLLDFSAPWCGPCRMMEATTFADRNAQDALKGFILVKVDFDHNAALVSKYNVHGIPTCILLNQFGEKVSANVGYVNAQEFGAWLARNKRDVFAAVSKSKAMTDRVQTLGKNLLAADAEARDKAIEGLLESYCTKDAPDDDGSSAKPTEAALRDFVQQRAAFALTYLNDQRLAVRILFTNLFSEKMGASFQFDPWEKAPARAVAVEKLATQINAQ